MTTEEIRLLLIDLCGRIPYGFIVHRYSDNCDISINNIDDFTHFLEYSEGEEFKPYLRPMSSMTEEEREWFRMLGGVMSYSPQHNTWAISAFAPEAYDWLNKKMFDFRGLIPMGLALEAPADMYCVIDSNVVDAVDDIMYDVDSDNVEVIYKSGKKISYDIKSLKLISSDERELGTECDYLIEPNIHVVFYPEGYISTFYFDE